jgi:hypothetical protein
MLVYQRVFHGLYNQQETQIHWSDRRWAEPTKTMAKMHQNKSFPAVEKQISQLLHVCHWNTILDIPHFNNRFFLPMLVAYLPIYFWDFYLTWLNLTLTEQLFWFYDYMLPMIGWLWLYMSRTSLLGVGRSIMIYFQLVTHSHLHTSMFVKWNSDRAATFQHGTQTCPFPLRGSMLELTCKFLKPTHLVWNKSGWWLQPSEKNITQMGLLFPRYGQIIKTFQTTNQKSSRIATNPPSKCKNPNQKHHPPSGPAHLSPCLDQQGGQVLFVS